MSNWTHVAGVMRIDDLRFDAANIPDFKAVFGKTLRFEDDWPEDLESRKDEYLPMGSEGSLELSVHVNEDVHSMAAYVVTIFGDLRDHDSPDEIINWFKEKYDLINSSDDFIGGVRNACIVAENEWNGIRTWTAGVKTQTIETEEEEE